MNPREALHIYNLNWLIRRMNHNHSSFFAVRYRPTVCSQQRKNACYRSNSLVEACLCVANVGFVVGDDRHNYNSRSDVRSSLSTVIVSFIFSHRRLFNLLSVQFVHRQSWMILEWMIKWKCNNQMTQIEPYLVASQIENVKPKSLCPKLTSVYEVKKVVWSEESRNM